MRGQGCGDAGLMDPVQGRPGHGGSHCRGWGQRDQQWEQLGSWTSEERLEAELGTRPPRPGLGVSWGGAGRMVTPGTQGVHLVSAQGLLPSKAASKCPLYKDTRHRIRPPNVPPPPPVPFIFINVLAD